MKPAGTRYSPFCGAETLRAALARILEDPAGELGVKEVRITQHWPRAAIYRTNGDEYLFGFSDFIKAQEHGFKIFPSRFEMVLSASTLCQLALELSEEK